MKNIKTGLIMGISLVISTLCLGQGNFDQIQSDFENATGSWQGSLTYLDYTSGKPFSMAANLEITRISKTNQYIFSNNYPSESNANSKDTVTISGDGKFLGQEKVISRTVLPNGNVEIVTEEQGKDGNDFKPASFRRTYTIGKTVYINSKEVQFEGTKDWIKRHEYSYTRIPGK